MSCNIKSEPVELIQIEDCYIFNKICLNDLFEYDMLLKSIEDVGVIEPMIARSTSKGFEIIIGRRRFLALRKLGVKLLPVIVREFTDDEAEIVVIENKITQRGIESLKHSEIAALIKSYHGKLKSQGRRTDLLREINCDTDLLGLDSLGRIKYLNSAEESGNKFKLSSRTISRYLRIYLLCDELKLLLDNELISIRVGVELSYLSNYYQRVIASFVETGFILTEEQARTLRELSRRDLISEKAIYKVTREYKSINKNYRCFDRLFTKYSLNRYSTKEINIILDKALKMYFESKGDSTFKVSWLSN